jgi:aspartyl-tRNA(Asn)/glutamyl-tRNA(Gln) amidotransferase subunit A
MAGDADIARLGAAALARAFRRGTLSPVEATRAAFTRIARHQPRLNAFRLLDEDGALAAARASEARWRRGRPESDLDGVPTTIKDQWMVAGWPTLKGSRTVTDHGPAQEDSPAVARLREAGAVLIGTTTMCEFGWKGIGDSPLTGISRNPWNPAMTPGGSSAGAAIAAALGLGGLHIGSDGAGSVRIPAAFCGVYGLKATFGRVPTWPTGRMQGISHVGPLVRTVEDAALALSIISRPDWRDPFALPHDPRDWRIGLNDGVRGLRIAYSRTLGYAQADADILACTDRAVAALIDLGAIVEECDPGFANPREPFELVWRANLAGVLASIPEHLHALMDQGYIAAARAGGPISGEDILQAGIARAALTRHMNAFHARYDLLVTPTLPLAAFPVGVDVPAGRGMTSWFDWNPFTFPFNATQQPAASVPCGLTPGGLPAGLQIVAARYREDLVLRASRAVETMLPMPEPPGFADM